MPRTTFKPSAIALAIAAALTAPPALRAEPETDDEAQRSRTTLERVEVEGQTQKRFKPDTTTTGLKGGGELRDSPQSVTVIPQALIESQGAVTIVEALRNVTGLTLASGEGGNTGDNVTIRGFGARTDQYIDGVRDNGQYIRDTYNIERVEVLKGPSSMLFGRGGTGGVINTVSKRPTGQELRAVTLMAGSESFLRGTADLDQPVGPDAGVRLNLLWTGSDSFRDTVEYDRYAVAGSTRFDVSDATRIDATLSYLDHDGILDYGLPFNLATGEPIDVPHDLNYGAGDQSIVQYEVFEGRVAFEHEFANGFNLRNTTAYGNFDRTYRTVRPNTIDVPVLTPAITIARNHNLTGGDQKGAYNLTDMLYDAQTGSVKHELAFGLEFDWEDFSQKRRAGLPALPPVPIFDPQSVVLPTLPSGFDGAALASSSKVGTDTASLYVQDRIVFNEQWSVVAGIRQDNFDADVQDALTGVTLSTDDDMTSYRLGTVFQPSETQSYYATWSTSFNPSAETFTLNPASAAIDPEENRIYEVGAKLTPLGPRLGINLAAFRLEKTNARTVDPSDTTVTILDGEQRSDGIEVELQGAITDRWDVFAGVVFLDAEITKSNNINSGVPIEGNEPVNTPESQANLWTTFDLGGGWEIGGGAFHVDSRYANTGNTLSVPSYTRIDASVSWTRGPLRVALNGYNLNDEEYFEFAHPVFATPGADRNYRATVNYLF
jgi:catecholate siderophore receptor